MRKIIYLIFAGILLTSCQSNKITSAKNKPTVKVSAANSVKALVKASARKHGVPAGLALAVSFQESGNRCNVRGAAGEIGPLQIKPASARGLGYKGSTQQLAKNCADQIEYGMRHLAAAFRRGGSCWKAAYLHNAGVYAKSYKIHAARRYANSVNAKASCA